MNKKIILSLGTIASVAAPVAAVVSCGEKSIEDALYSEINKDITRHANEELVINVNFNLDTLTSPGIFDSWYTDAISSSTKSMMNGFITRYTAVTTEMETAMSATGHNPTVEQMAAVGRSLQHFKQVTHNEFAKMHTITTNTAVTYKSSHGSIPVKRMTPFNEMNYEFFNSLRDQKTFMNALPTIRRSAQGMLNDLSGSSNKDWLWAFFSSAQYAAWYKDKVTDAGVDATHLTSLSDTFYPIVVDPFTGQTAVNTLSSNTRTISLPLMPTRAQVNSYLDDCVAAVRSGMATTE